MIHLYVEETSKDRQRKPELCCVERDETIRQGVVVRIERGRALRYEDVMTSTPAAKIFYGVTRNVATSVITKKFLSHNDKKLIFLKVAHAPNIFLTL